MDIMVLSSMISHHEKLRNLQNQNVCRMEYCHCWATIEPGYLQMKNVINFDATVDMIYHEICVAVLKRIVVNSVKPHTAPFS